MIFVLGDISETDSQLKNAATAETAVLGKMISSLTRYLGDFSLSNSSRVIPEPKWELSNFIDQCRKDPTQHTQGAFVISLVATNTGSTSLYIVTKNWVEIAANVTYVSCEPSQGSNTPTVSYQWISQLQDVTHIRRPVNWILIASTVLALGSLYTIFTPSKSLTVTSTKVFPASPPPAGGAVSQVVTATGSTSNVSSAASIGAGLLPFALNVTNAGQSLPISDALTWDAVDELAQKFVGELNCPLRNIRWTYKEIGLPSPSPESTPLAKICGAAPSQITSDSPKASPSPSP